MGLILVCILCFLSHQSIAYLGEVINNAGIAMQGFGASVLHTAICQPAETSQIRKLLRKHSNATTMVASKLHKTFCP
jgi:hypothetical protein